MTPAVEPTLDDIDLTDMDRFAESFPHEWFTFLRARGARLVPRADARDHGRRRLLGRHQVRRRRRGVARLADVLVGEVAVA